jgi:hypothetical protein
MRLALLPATLEREEVHFEVDRFEPEDNGRLELSGRWFGVRGRRFVRPTLTIVTELSRTRMLADLEHKPWAADDGELWQASFPWDPDGTDVVDVELAVATDIAISLPAPGADTDSGPRAPAGLSSARGDEPAPAPPSQDPDPEDVLHELTRALKAEHRKARRLVAELERARSEAVDATADQQQAQATIAELQEALAEAMGVGEQAMIERDEAIEARALARTEHDQEARIRDQALAERDKALAERDKALAERDEALAKRDAAVAARDELLAARDAAVAERDRAQRSRERAIAEGRRLLAERKDANQELGTELTRALSERDMVLRALDAMKAESEAQMSKLQAQLEATPKLDAPVWQPPAIARSAHSARRTRVDWLRRAIALTVLLAVVIALLVVLRLV